jgi:hypothetical protein
MFAVAHGHLIGQPNAELMNELMSTAKQLVGGAADQLEAEQVADLTRLFRSEGVAAAWKDAGVSAKDVAEQLMAASYGVKHRATDPADYKKRMRIAIQLACASRPAR